MAAETPGSPEDYSLFLSENGHLSFENPNYQLEPIGRIDSARMEDHINSNVEPSVPLSVYQELYQELGGHRGLSNGSGNNSGSRRNFPNIDLQNLELDRGQGLDNKNMDADMTGVDTNKVAESIYAEKTAKLHRLLGEKEEKGFRLDLESPESEKLTDSVSEKEEKEVDELEEEKAAPVRRRVKKRSELPLGWEKHEDSEGAYYWHIKSGTIQREPPHHEDTGEEESMVRHTVRSSRIFDSDPADFVPSTGMQKSCTASSIADLGKEKSFREERLEAIQKKEEEKWKRRSLPSAQNEDGRSGFKSMQVVVVSLGWCELADEDLTPENSSKAVNRCIVDLSSKEREGGEVAGVWGNGEQLILQLDEGSLKLIETETGETLNCQPIHAIRVWGVGRDNGKDFAYVSRDKQTRKHMCHVFRCQVAARTIANALRDICKKILIERSLAQSSSKLTEKLVSSERRERNASRPTSLAVDNPKLPGKLPRGGAEASSETFPTPMEEPRKVIKAWYLGSLQVSNPGGMETVNAAIAEKMETVSREDWQTVTVAVAPSTVSISFMDGQAPLECRVRFLSFLGIGSNVQQAAFIMHTAQDTFICHVFHCEPTAGPLCKTIEAACKLRYQKCLDARPASGRDQEVPNSRNSIGATIKNMFGAFNKKSRSPEVGNS